VLDRNLEYDVSPSAVVERYGGVEVFECLGKWLLCKVVAVCSNLAAAISLSSAFVSIRLLKLMLSYSSG
jgi:hypothetical protein